MTFSITFFFLLGPYVLVFALFFSNSFLVLFWFLPCSFLLLALSFSDTYLFCSFLILDLLIFYFSLDLSYSCLVLISFFSPCLQSPISQNVVFLPTCCWFLQNPVTINFGRNPFVQQFPYRWNIWLRYFVLTSFWKPFNFLQGKNTWCCLVFLVRGISKHLAFISMFYWVNLTQHEIHHHNMW